MDDDDTTPTDDDDDNVVSASGIYQQNYDFGTDLENAGYSDCTANYNVVNDPNPPHTGCPGCFAVFRVDFNLFSDNCSSTFDPYLSSQIPDLEVGVSGNTLWIYYNSTWQTLNNGSATSNSFTGESDWFEEDGYAWQEIYQFNWN